MGKRTKKIDSVKFYHVDPRSLLEDVNSIPELYYLANTMMASNQRNKVSPEVPLLIGYDAYSKLISFYGGASVYIPSKDELQQNLLGVMSYYYYNIKGLSWNDTIKKLGLTPTKGSRRLIRNRWKVFKDLLDSNEIKIPSIYTTEPHEMTLEHSPIRCDDSYIPHDLYMKVVRTIVTDLNENDIIDDAKVDLIIERYEQLG